MQQDRMMQAIGRIERALARLELVDFKASRDSAESADLRLRHDRLRHETEATISHIDHLLHMVKD
jgi:hypothetical protein